MLTNSVKLSWFSLNNYSLLWKRMWAGGLQRWFICASLRRLLPSACHLFVHEVGFNATVLSKHVYLLPFSSLCSRWQRLFLKPLLCHTQAGFRIILWQSFILKIAYCRWVRECGRTKDKILIRCGRWRWTVRVWRTEQNHSGHWTDVAQDSRG